MHLVVASDDNDANTGSAAPLDGVKHLLAGRVQHANNTHECQVHFICVELGRVAQIHVLRLDWIVCGGQRQAPQCVSAGTILPGQVQDAVFQCGRQRHLQCNSFIIAQYCGCYSLSRKKEVATIPISNI